MCPPFSTKFTISALLLLFEFLLKIKKNSSGVGFIQSPGIWSPSRAFKTTKAWDRTGETFMATSFLSRLKHLFTYANCMRHYLEEKENIFTTILVNFLLNWQVIEQFNKLQLKWYICHQKISDNWICNHNWLQGTTFNWLHGFCLDAPLIFTSTV